MYIGFDSVASGATVKTVADLATVPPKATGVEIQAVSNHIAYTMDNATDPTATAGMLLLTTEGPKAFDIVDLKRIRFIQVTGAGKLQLHYFGGRDI